MFKIVNGEKIPLSQEEITSLHEQWAATNAELAKIAYRDERKRAYKSIFEQLDMLFHDLNTHGTINTEGTWFQHVKSVKETHKKPEVN